MLYAECWSRPEKWRKAKSAGSSCFGACRHLRMYARFFIERKKKLDEETRCSEMRRRAWLSALKNFASQTILERGLRRHRQECLCYLWEEAAHERRFSHAVDGENHGAGARWNVMLAHGVHHFEESADHNLLQARVDFVSVPHQAFLILHPLKVADSDAASVGQNVGQHG